MKFSKGKHYVASGMEETPVQAHQGGQEHIAHDVQGEAEETVLVQP